MNKKVEEWFRQADYDLKTARHLLAGKRYIYSVFMCHLAIEKALKGVYQQQLKKSPPKVHNLVFFVEKIGLKLPEDLYGMIFKVNRASIPTRYPDDLKRMLREYNGTRSSEMLEKSAEILRWLKRKLKK